MKTKYRFMGLVGSLVCLGSGAAYAEGQSAPDDLPENLPSISIPAPATEGQGVRTQYAMKFAPPSPEVDYRIGRMPPDPAIDYRIMIPGPSPRLFPVKTDTREEELPGKYWGTSKD